MQAKATTVCVQKQKHPTLLILHLKCAPFSCSCYPLQSTCRRISPTKSIWFMIYLGSEQWFSGCSIPRIKDQEGKRTVTYLAVIVVHWVMWSTSCALDAREIRLLFFTTYFHYRQVYVLNVFRPIPTFPDSSAGNNRITYEILYRCTS